MSALHARPGSEAEAWAEGLAWLWRLGAVEPAPGPNAIGVGTESEAAELSRDNATQEEDPLTKLVTAFGGGMQAGKLARQQQPHAQNGKAEP